MNAALKRLIQDEGTLGSNPSSIHAHGRKAKKYLSEARERVALSLGASPEDLDLHFLRVLKRINSRFALRLNPVRNGLENLHWITTPVEHECNLKMQDWVRERGGDGQPASRRFERRSDRF